MKKHTRVLVVSALSVLVITVLVLFFSLFNKSKTCLKQDLDNCNIVMIVADALRPDVLGCYGGDVKTPNIDRLAGKGVLFEKAYSTAPCTMPSSVSMFTGNYSRAYGIIQKDEHKHLRKKYSFYINDNDRLFAEILEEKGYDVLMDVENKVASRSNNLQGFKEFRKIDQMGKEEIAIVENTIGIKNIGWSKRTLYSSNYDRLYDLLFYLLTVPARQNFFLLKWFLDPHFPYNPPEKFRKNIPVDTSKLPHPPGYYCKITLKDLNEFSDYEKYVFLKELYKAEVQSLDERVGYILKALKHRGLLDKTLIIFTSDHGEAFGEHGLRGHGWAFIEPMVAIPLIITGPGIPGGKREKTVISLLDLIPTLKDLLGLTYEENMQGKSFSAILSENSIDDRIVYFDRLSNLPVGRKDDSNALLMNGFKLIVNDDDENNRFVFQLFNLADDPGEMKDISRENPDIIKRMYKKILDLRKSNNTRLKKNLAKIGKDVNLVKELEKTIEELKALGYL